MDLLSKLNDFAAAHHLFALALLAAFFSRVLRPILVDVRATLVEGLAVGRATVKKFGGLTESEIAAERPEAEKAIPAVPEPSALEIVGAVVQNTGPK